MNEQGIPSNIQGLLYNSMKAKEKKAMHIFRFPWISPKKNCIIGKCLPSTNTPFLTTLIKPLGNSFVNADHHISFIGSEAY